MVFWWSARLSRTCILGIMLENVGFFQNQPIGEMVFCFNYYIPWMHYERLYLATCWKITYSISLLVFFPIGMPEPFDLSGPHHLLLGCTAYCILFSKLQCSCLCVLYCHEQGYEWHFIYSLHKYNPTAFSSNRLSLH